MRLFVKAQRILRSLRLPTHALRPFASASAPTATGQPARRVADALADSADGIADTLADTADGVTDALAYAADGVAETFADAAYGSCDAAEEAWG